MEKPFKTEPGFGTNFQGLISELPTVEEKNISHIKSIYSFADQFIIKNEPIDPYDFFQQYPASKLAGVYLQGVQYYDLKNIFFINNTGMANLIDLLRSLVKEGVEVRFVNVNDNIKNKIRSMGLDHVLNCS